MYAALIGAFCCVVLVGVASAAQNGQVEVSDGRWLVTVRVDQDRASRSESGFAQRIATTIAARKILEFGCKVKPGSGERISAQLRGLVTLGSKETSEWAEVVVAAPVQPLKCKIEKSAASADVVVATPEPQAEAPDPSVLREVKTDY
jgi:hypothetical protein